ncbi:protein-disulfide reductase DsbD domain-containing protein [Luteolibacter sp. AS25]|uniref:protein-disulfide reductase DsbD domain-containing protein n=1 Tax=Luteolibacter sp. AS25 TaxID=3135776 RepID=UPI00398B9482
MHKILISIVSCIAIGPLSAGMNKATAEWFSTKTVLSSAEKLETVIVMKIDKGWHTYWENPGEGGLRLSLKAELPVGWELGEIQYPAPIRFMTGELPGFGYEGSVRFPVTVTPPENFKGEIPDLSAKLTWLTCNDESCIPGNSELNLTPAQTEGIVSKAYKDLPQEIPGAHLSLVLDGKTVTLKLTLPEDSDIDPTTYELFPATEEIVDPSARITFVKDPTIVHTWTSTWPVNEYCDSAPDSFTLVLKKEGKASLKITTK